VHHITPHAYWHPTLAGDLPSFALVPDNPFLLTPYRTRDGRTVMASGVYPHLAAKWCRFLDVPPDYGKVAAAFAGWDSYELEEAANEATLPLCVARTPQEWLAHPQGALLATQPVIGLTRIGDAPPREFGAAERPFDGVRVLSFTDAIAGPTVGRTLAEQGAEVLCATRPMDYEHDFIYAKPISAPAVPTSTSPRTAGKRMSSAFWPTRTSSSTTTAAPNWRNSASTRSSSPTPTPAWCTYRSPATDRRARGRTAADST
jgi:hypothetical protein